MKKYVIQPDKMAAERYLSIAVFTLFSAWMISFPYEGQVLYALAKDRGIELGIQMQVAIGTLIVGILCGFFVTSTRLAKWVMIICTAVCLAGSLCFFFIPDFLWLCLLLILSFCEGLWTSSWGWFFRDCTPQGMRIKTASACLAYSAILMIGVNLVATRVSAYLGLFIAMLLLMGSFLLSLRLPSKGKDTGAVYHLADSMFCKNSIVLLCLFILVITINSGLMFSFINPAFANLTKITDWYWAIPYITVILAGGHLPKTIDRSHLVFSAISMLGLSFLAFITMDRSIGAYLVVDTLLLAACGINDLFWWTILGEMLDLYRNPSKILGIGLAANVVGVLIGEIIVKGTALMNYDNLPVYIGLTVVFLSLMILPPLQKRLARQMKEGQFGIPPLLSELKQKEAEKMNGEPVSLHPVSLETVKETEWIKQNYDLTNREYQIALLLLKGYTRQLIASELFISETTVKTHIHNVYNKLKVKNKTELICKIKTMSPGFK